MVWLGSPTTHSSWRPPSHWSSRNCCSGRDVLVLVDDEVPVLAADGLGDVLAVLQHAAQQGEHVLEVDDAAGVLRGLVGREQARHGRVVVAGRGGPVGRRRGADVVVGRDEAHLGPLDLGGEVADREPVDPQPEGRRRLGDERRLLLEDPRGRAAHDLGPEVAQLAQRSGVEGAGLDADDAEVAEPGAHLPRRPGREGDRQHALRRVRAGADAVGDAMGDGARLAGPGAGEHADRPRQGDGDRALIRVQGGEEIVGGHRQESVRCRRHRPTRLP